MAWTNWGFDGTINEAQWAQMAGLLGNGYVAAGNSDCLVTAVGGARSVSVAAGTLYGDGVVSVNSAPETVAMTTPVNGQWYVIALRRTWATNTAALVAIAGATTTTTTPTTVPSSFPTLNTNTGVLTDQPIAWAWCNSANTTVVVFDLRLMPLRTANELSASSDAQRDAKIPVPVQGQRIWRNDLGYAQRYFGLYNASTNPGGLSVAGWFRDLGKGQKALLGQGIRSMTSSVYNLPASGYADMPDMTTTVVTSGLQVKVSVSVTLRNGASGSPRSAQWKLLVDGALLGVDAISYQSVYYNTTTDHTTIEAFYIHTPTAASHTYKVQANTALGASVQFISGQVLVEEIYN